MASASARDDILGSNLLKAQLAAKKNSAMAKARVRVAAEFFQRRRSSQALSKTNDENQNGENGWTAQGREGLRRQIENVRHRQAVGIEVVILEQVRDAAFRRNIERGDDQVAQAHRGHQSDHGESGLQAREPAVFRFFGVAQANSQQDGDRGPGAEAVVLHARSAGEGKEKQNQSGPDEEQQTGLLDWLHLRSPGFWPGKLAQGVGDEKAPGKEPDQVQGPPQQQRYGFIVRRIAGAEGALEVLVDEVGPEESGRAVFRDPVPGHGDDQEDQGAGEDSQFAPASPAAGEDDEEKDDAEREEHADQAQRERGQRHHDRRAPIGDASIQGALPAAQKKIEQRGQFQREDGFRNHDAGEQPCVPRWYT